MRTEGVYTYFCEECETLFAVVARFAVAGDYSAALKCPKCGRGAPIKGEGSINHQSYEVNEDVSEVAAAGIAEDDEYPDIMNAEHIAEVIGISKRVAYEIMERRGFPLIRIGRLKRVRKDEFHKWLNSEEKK